MYANNRNICILTYLSCRCPWQHDTLASGGGTADRHIRLWNTTQGACVKGIDTGSQVYILYIYTIYIHAFIHAFYTQICCILYVYSYTYTTSSLYIHNALIHNVMTTFLLSSTLFTLYM